MHHFVSSFSRGQALSQRTPGKVPFAQRALPALALFAVLAGCQPSPPDAPPAPTAPAGVAPPAPEKSLPAPKEALKHLNASVLPAQKDAAASATVGALPVAQAIAGRVAKLMQSDKNADLALSFDEFHTALGLDIEQPVVKKLFTRVDSNQDGRLQPAELQAYVEPGVRATDANRNGYLDEGDVAALRKSNAPAAAPGAEAGTKARAPAAPASAGATP